MSIKKPDAVALVGPTATGYTMPLTAQQSAVPVIANETKQSVQATLKIYDVLGNEVAMLVNENQSAGNYEVNFDAKNLSSGIYFCKLQAGSLNQSIKMTLLK